MDHAHLLQRAGRNLQGIGRRGCAASRSAPAIRALYWPSLPSPRRSYHADLYGRRALLRSQSVARFPEPRASYLALRPKMSRIFKKYGSFLDAALDTTL